LSYRLNSNQKSEINLTKIKNKLTELEKVLNIKKFSEQEGFKKWQDDFKLIYGSKYTDIRLYLTHSLIYLIGHFLILKYIFKKDKSFLNDEIRQFNIQKIRTQVKRNYRKFNLFEFVYFDPIQKYLDKNDLNAYNDLLAEITDYISNSDKNPEYFFDYFVQKIIPQVVRHKTGEFYTPNFIVKKMVNESYEFGERVIDPCCGSGNFLIEIVKKILYSKNSEERKISAINNIFGYDINPISIFMTKISYLILTEKYFSRLKVNFYVLDSLFLKHNKNKKIPFHEKLFNTFDLVIGNPPWYTFRDIDSVDYQNQVKLLAEKLGIKPLPKNILNIEISALFFYQAKQIYLKKNGKIFFVITKGVITGSHASRFRNFQGFKNIKIWQYEKKLEKVFNIDFICIFAQKSENTLELSNREIDVYHLKLNEENKSFDYFDDLELILEKREPLVPYYVEKKGSKTFTKKFISKKLHTELVPYGESRYKKLFHKGADLNPRNLIFVKYEDLNDSLVKINPDDRIFKKAKSPWNKKEFNNEIIDKKYIFKVVKSTELVKFYIHDFYNVFLPLSKKDLKFNFDELTENAKWFYNKINQIYLRYKKVTTKHNSIMDNLNRWEKLINNRQLSKIKVVYNNSGSILNSAVIVGDYLVTGDLSFYITNNLDEAFYLSSILNSNLMSKQVKIRKSSRHIFKIPFEIPIKIYNPRVQNHRKLAELGMECYNIAKKTVKDIIKKDNNNVSKIKLQKALKLTLKSSLNQIDEIFQLELN
jgi:hypothetical protein